MRETVPGSRLRKMPILYLLKILPNEITEQQEAYDLLLKEHST